MREGGGVAGSRPSCFPRPRVDPVVEDELEQLRQVEVAGQNIRLFAEGARFDTAAGAALAGVFHGFALANQFLDHGIGVEDRGKTIALADDLEPCSEESVRVLRRELEIIRRLKEVHLVDDLEQQVRDFVDSVFPIAAESAKVDVGEIGVGAALGGGHPDLGRRRVVVELDEETAEQFLGLVAAQAAVDQTAFVERA